MTLRSPAWLVLTSILLIPSVARAQDDLFQVPSGVASIQPMGVLRGHEKFVFGVAYSPDGKRIASASEDTAVLWDATTGKLVARLDPGEAGLAKAHAVAFSPDGKTLAVGGYVGDVYLYDAASGAFQSKLDEPSLAVLCLAYSPDGKILAASHDQAEVMLFDIEQSKLVGTIKPAKGSIRSFAFAADSKTLATITSEELATWDVETQKLQNSRPLPNAGVEWSYTAVTCSPKTPLVVATGGRLLDPKTVAYDLKTLKPRGGLVTNMGDPSIESLAFSPDGKVLASAGAGIIGHVAVSLWNPSTGKRFAVLLGSKETLNQVVFSPDGGRVVAASDDNTVIVWTIKAGAKKSAR